MAEDEEGLYASIPTAGLNNVPCSLNSEANCDDLVSNIENSGECSVSAPEEEEEPLENEEGNRIIAKGIASVLNPVMKDFDAGVEAALKSQGVLQSSIDRLTRELDKLLEDAPVPFVTQNGMKLSRVRKRVAKLNSTLQVIQRRTDNIERMLSGQVMVSPQTSLHGAHMFKSEGRVHGSNAQHVKVSGLGPQEVSETSNSNGS